MAHETSTDRRLQQLFVLNRSVLDSQAYARLLEFEQQWITPVVASLEANAPRIGTRAELMTALDHLLEQEKNTPSETADFLANQSSREHFKVVVEQFALDGLTEAQSFFPIMGRLPIQAQMPIMRVLIDEFGCGNPDQAHSQLYRDLLTELGLPLELGHYLDLTNDETYAFVNVFFWLTQRASHPEYFLGALAYLENSVPFAFSCFAAACERLGIAKHHYYTEHMHIDGFHAREMRAAIREYEAAAGLDYTRAWVGIQLGSALIGQAFDAAVNRARKEVMS
jgi:hypothetical protein